MLRLQREQKDYYNAAIREKEEFYNRASTSFAEISGKRQAAQNDLRNANKEYMRVTKQMNECIDSNFDYCYECEGYGDDYSVDENGELVHKCETCPSNPFRGDWDD